VGLAFVTGGAGIAISVGGTSQQLRTMLRDKTAAQLEYDGRAALATMGVSEATADAFYATPNLTPTDKAVIVEALKSLGTTSGREIFIAGAAHAQSIEMGFFYRRQAELIAGFDKRSGACLRADERCPDAANRQGHGEHLASGPSLLESAARRSRLWRARRADLDHWTGEPDGDLEACCARLDRRPESRRAARSINPQHPKIIS
jgi:hypothetical protein